MRSFGFIAGRSAIESEHRARLAIVAVGCRFRGVEGAHKRHASGGGRTPEWPSTNAVLRSGPVSSTSGAGCVSATKVHFASSHPGSQSVNGGHTVIITSTAISGIRYGTTARDMRSKETFATFAVTNSTMPTGGVMRADHQVQHEDEAEMHRVDAERERRWAPGSGSGSASPQSPP